MIRKIIVKELETLKLALKGWELNIKGLRSNNKGEWWLLIQSAIILLHLIKLNSLIIKINLSSNLIFHVIGIITIVYGTYLMIYSFKSLGASLSPLPEPKKGSKLVVDLAYKKCRHPLYKSLIICSLGTAIYLISIYHLILFSLLCFVLRSKAIREESSLIIKHSNYLDYMSKVPAIIQFVPYLDWRKEIR
tara:strand:+ start:3456 stop:4028 length:573 start_codon:yes stop_codon:yes gene_type:complete